MSALHTAASKAAQAAGVQGCQQGCLSAARGVATGSFQLANSRQQCVSSVLALCGLSLWWLLCSAGVMLSCTGTGAAAEAAGTAADSASHSSGIPAAYNTTSSSKNAIDSHRRSTDCASTSYPTTSYGDDWDALGACMTTAMEMEACVDAVVRP
jgi:hypothetical protein